MKYFTSSIILLCSILGMGIIPIGYSHAQTASAAVPPTVIHSIDTMKYSRDLSREKLKDPSFDAEIKKEMQLIKESGATHVAIDTPYDEEFAPMLERWVAAARAEGLSVWFRGNFSGWEGWFGYKKIDRASHEQLLASFLKNHSDLFKNGDVFTPCPECENGGPGDPRNTKDSAGYNQFLVDEYDISHDFFTAHDLSVSVYTGMNYDIAWQILTPATAASLGGTILIDHYVSSSKKFGDDIANLKNKLHAAVGIGEFGAPIPDLNGNMNETDQADFIHSLTDALIQNNVTIANYWTLKGGSTALIDGKNNTKDAYQVIQQYFKTPFIYGTVTDEIHRPISGATLIIGDTTQTAHTDAHGSYQTSTDQPATTVTVEKDGYVPTTFSIASAGMASALEQNVYLKPVDISWWYSLKRFFINLFNTQ